MRQLILDYSIWRSGLNGDNQTGDGGTKLLNHQGYMCCLGQFSKQLNLDLTDEDIMNIGTPSSTYTVIPDLSVVKLAQGGTPWRSNTPLSQKAMDINDNNVTTPEQKISALKKLFNQHGYTIKVINRPENKENEQQQ